MPTFIHSIIASTFSQLFKNYFYFQHGIFYIILVYYNLVFPWLKFIKLYFFSVKSNYYGSISGHSIFNWKVQCWCDYHNVISMSLNMILQKPRLENSKYQWKQTSACWYKGFYYWSSIYFDIRIEDMSIEC